MRLTATQLRRIIREETQRVLEDAEPQRGVEQAIAFISDADNALAGAAGELRHSQEISPSSVDDSDFKRPDEDPRQVQINALEEIRVGLGTVMDELDKLKGLY